MDFFESIVNGIGNTPLVKISGLPAIGNYQIFAKAEHLNAGGSVKSRTALAMIRDARSTGELLPGDTIVEVSSGNEGVALAMLGAVYGHAVCIVMPDDVPPERRALIERYGGTVIPVEAGDNIAQTLRRCFAKAEQLARTPGHYYARQFENPANARVHEETTGAELLEQSSEPIAAFVAGVGTGGTLTGVGRAIKKRYPSALVIAVEPSTAAVLTGGAIGTHRQFGIGEGFVPALLDRDLVDETIAVSDGDAYETCCSLARYDGLMVGPTSGSNVFAALEIARRLGPDKIVATVLPDTAERYLSLPEFASRAMVTA